VAFYETSSLARIASLAGSIVLDAVHLFAGFEGWDGKKGAYFCWADDVQTGAPSFILRIGEVQPEKSEKYLTLCAEKARRLAGYPDHFSSWQTRNPNQNLWGGAVRGYALLSLSGFPELGDEACMLVLMRKIWPELESRADRIAEMSSNPYYKLLWELVNRKA
jgi:hypothetical protein